MFSTKPVLIKSLSSKIRVSHFGNKLVTKSRAEKIILACLLVSSLSIFNHNIAEAVSIVSKKVAGNISCDMLRTSSPAEMTFEAEGKFGEKEGLHGSYNVHANDSLESIGIITNISKFDTNSNSYVLSYEGNAVNCPLGESPFNPIISGSCGQQVSIKFTSKFIIGQFAGNVTCGK